MGRWRFRPSAPVTLLTLCACGVMLWLGGWQWRRGLQKEHLDTQYAEARAQAPVALTRGLRAPDGGQAQAVTARGRYLPDRQVLLDNQVRGRVPGYHVWTPLRLADGSLAIVDRGWLPQDPDRRVLPDLTVADPEVRVEGLWRALPQPGLRLASHDCDPQPAPRQWPLVQQYPTVADLTCLYDEPVLAGELLLAPDAAGGYVREWAIGDNGFPPARHFGYALQWFAFAATLLAIFFKLNLKRRVP